jgi:hypothetical protein
MIPVPFAVPPETNALSSWADSANFAGLETGMGHWSIGGSNPPLSVNTVDSQPWLGIRPLSGRYRELPSQVNSGRLRPHSPVRPSPGHSPDARPAALTRAVSDDRAKGFAGLRTAVRRLPICDPEVVDGSRAGHGCRALPLRLSATASVPITDAGDGLPPHHNSSPTRLPRGSSRPMSHAAIAAVLRLEGVSASERLAAFSLASCANREHRAWPGTGLAAGRAGLSYFPRKK